MAIKTEGFSTNRSWNGTRLYWNGCHIGEAFKFTGAPGYGLRLHGVYWNKGMANTRGGSSTTNFRLMRDAVSKAEVVIKELHSV